MPHTTILVALLVLSGCSGPDLHQQGHVPSYRQPFLTAPANSTYEPPGSIPP